MVHRDSIYIYKIENGGFSVASVASPGVVLYDSKQQLKKLAYTPTSTADVTGNVGDFSYDAGNLYLKTTGGWVSSPLFPLGYYPLGIPVVTKTIAGIQAVYDAIPDGSTVDILLSGIYMRQGTESLNVTSNKKTVRFVSYSNARIHDPNTTATPASLVFINNQIGGGWDGVHFSSDSNYTGFNYGVVFLNESAPTVNYTFKNGSVTAPAFLGNGITVQAYSKDNNGGAGGGCIHRNLLFENFTFYKLGRMGLEFTCHNETEAGRPTRIFDVTVQRCTFDDLGLVVKDGMGCSFSGSLENVKHINNTYVDCKQYCVEFIGTRSGISKANKMLGGKLWGEGANGTGNNLTNGYNFTDGQNAGLGAKNLTIVGDEISVQGRPMLAYGCANLTFKFGKWTGGAYVDFNQGGGNGVAGDHCSNITLQNVDITVQGDGAYNVMVMNNCDIMKVIDCNMKFIGNNGYSVFNAENNCTQVTLSGGHWSRPKTAQDAMYNVRATNSPAVGVHYESTF